MSERSAAPDGYVAELDGLRGIAILAVMVHRMYPHADGTPWLVEAGWAGVDLFFVISGFLIAGILIDARGEPGYFRNFYARRVLRIFPLFYLFIGGILLAFPIAMHSDFLREAGSPLWYLFQLGNIPEGVLGRDPPYWLAPVWSLAIEEQFYLTFPLLVAWVAPQRLARWLAGIAVLALVVRIATTALVPELDRLQYLFTLCRLDTIAAGCLLAVFVRSERYRAWQPQLPRVLVPVILAAAAVLFVTQLDRTTWFGRTFGYNVVAIGLAALVLLTYELRQHPATGVLRSIVLRYPGKLCFGLYLLHRPADTVVTALVQRASFDEMSLVWLPVKIGVALVFATVSWRIIELPFLRMKQRFTTKPRPLALRSALPTATALLVLLFAAVGCGERAGIASAPVAGLDAPWDGTSDGNCDAPATDADAPDAPGRDASAPDGHPGDAAHPGDAQAGDAPVDLAPDAAVPDASPAPDAPPDASQPDAPPDAPAPPPGRVLYPEGALMSPITVDIAADLAGIAARGAAAEQVFGKIGDSITATTSFLACFNANTDLGDHAGLATTRDYFRAGNAAGATPFARTSLAATGGWTTADVLAGSPSPLDKELTAVDPRYATILLGTNDVRTGRPLDAFGSELWTIVDRTIAQGTIPIVSTMPTMHGDSSALPRITVFNRVIRAIAQGRSLPLIDFHLALSTLANEGITGDGLHPTVAPEGACALTDNGLAYGYNVRNLLTLQALDRTRRARDGECFDNTAQRRQGHGSHSDPYRGQLPLVDLADARAGEAGFAGFPRCGLTTSGREVVYRVDLAAATAVDAFVVDRDAVDVDVAILAGSLDEGACVAGGAQTASATVGPGPVYIVVDSKSAATEGEFVVVVQAH